MIINELEKGGQHLPLVQQQGKNTPQSKQSVTFADTMREFISDVNNLQVESKDLQEAFIKGEPVDLHDVMISAEKAKTSFELLLELRNKALDLYREVNRLQV